MQLPVASLMDSFGIIYPQYYQMKVADANFEQHLDHYRAGCNFSPAKYLRGILASMFLPALLDMQASFFELIMKENTQSMLQKLITTNLVI